MTLSQDAMPIERLQAELLSPVGDRECLRAAVENGADAVYFGLESGFNARVRATNLQLDELPEVMDYLHERGVRGYVTLNTLIFPSELAEIERTVIRLTEADVDAVLVQDLGLLRLIREVSPELELHASTQMTLTSGECLAAIEPLGVRRVVLARELSLDEIRKIRQQTSLELEAFVHGALCVAYSGQCLTSESLGGRSANRGQCAQACRLPYDLICDGQDVDLERVRYLLSPQDLAAYAMVPEMLAAGIQSFKIEGRLKTAEYVANITRHYRRAIDAALRQQPLTWTKQDVTEMELSFSRGFSPGWLEGCDHKRLVPGLSSAKRGVRLGHVVAVRGSRVQVRLCEAVSRGDGLLFESEREREVEQGGRVYELYRRGRPVTELTVAEGDVELAFGHDSLDLRQLRVGQTVWKTDDPRLTARLRKTYSGPDAVRRVPLDLKVEAFVGQPLRVRGQAANGATCCVESEQPLEVARRHPLTEQVLREQLGRLGGSVFELRQLEARLGGEAEGMPMVPLSVLGQVRKKLLEQLRAGRTRRVRMVRPLGTENRVLAVDLAPSHPPGTTGSSSSPLLTVLCRSLAQLPTALEAGVGQVMVDFADIREYREAVAMTQTGGAEIWLATPRIQKPDEMGVFHAMAKQGANGWLVRNLAGVRYCVDRDIPFIADFSLNAANAWTVDWLWEQGARRVTASYDLNREQLFELVTTVAPQRLEVVIHQHMPMFHMEHCVFCAVLSPGTNKTNCGRPCDRHEVKLRDRVGMEHLLTADVGCRNTLFNAVPQSAAEAVPGLLQRGIVHFRLELLQDVGSQLQTMLELYRQLLAGELSGKAVWQQLRASNRVGVTRGTLEERRLPLAIL
jgi:putative protease